MIVGKKEHAVLDATAHSLKFADFQQRYFTDSFAPSYGVRSKADLVNAPCLLLPEEARAGVDDMAFAHMAADAVVKKLGLAPR